MMDEAFAAGVISKLKFGLQIWGIDNHRLYPLPTSSHGKFYSGSAYIVLNTFPGVSHSHHDIHYWIGLESTQADANLASEKVLELDDVLGSCAVQYREVQGSESEKFLSYFKPCVIPVQGNFSSTHSLKKHYQISLLRCKGDHAISVTQVPFSRSSLSHNDVFILDTEEKIYLFCGSKSSIPERAKALEVVQYIKDNNHGGRCEVSHIDDGKFANDPNVGQFWSLFGGYAPLGRKSKEEVQINVSKKLYWINKGKICPLEFEKLERSIFKPNWCYMLDCGGEIFVWMGRGTLVTERKMAITATEDLVRSQDRSMNTRILILTEGSETPQFKLQFQEWPSATAASLYEEGKEKVAAIFKYQGYDVKEIPEDNLESFIDCCGTLKVWLVDSGDISLVPVAEQAKLYSGNCYIVQYSYPYGERNYHLIYTWHGRGSAMEDQIYAVSHMSTMVESMKGHPVMAQVYESNEPIQFFDIFQTLLILKGGMSSGYRRLIAESGCADETYNKDKKALFRVQGSGRNNMQGIQVDLVSSSLNSSYCYILQDEEAMFAWTGNLSSRRDQIILHRMNDFINPVKQPVSVREGTEPAIFWNAIGEKMQYPKEKENKLHFEDPHLFSCILKEGWLTQDSASFDLDTFPSDDLKVKEIFTFSQDDLNTEEVLVLDCYSEIYVWLGQHAGIAHTEALTIGKKFVELDILLEDLSLDTAIYVVTEGNEPPFFTCFFEWDFSKASIHGNSFERKLAILKGLTHQKCPRSPSKTNARPSEFGSVERRKPNGLDRSRMRSVSPAPSGLSHIKTPKSSRSQSPVFVLKRPTDSPTYVKRPTDSPTFVKRPTDSPTYVDTTQTKDATTEDRSYETLPSNHLDEKPPEVAVVTTPGAENGEEDLLKTFPYELLKVPVEVIVTGIDMDKREAYLSSKEFEEIFGMTKDAFYKLPLWRQKRLKKTHSLF